MNNALITQARITKAFIEADLYEIRAIKRRNLVSDGAGGRTNTWVDKTGIWRVRIIPQSASSAGYTTSEDGQQIQVRAGLLAMPNEDLLKHDRFTHLNRNYEIASIQYVGETYRLVSDLVYVGDLDQWQPED